MKIKPTMKMLFDCKTVNEVVNLLRTFNIKQKKSEHWGHSSTCPISQYVKRATHKKDVASCQQYIRVGNKQKPSSAPIVEFIYGFDHGVYPEFKYYDL